MDEATRLRRVLERRRERLREAETRAADAEALSAQLSAELERVVEDRRVCKSTEIRAGLRSARAVDQPALFPLGGLS